MDQCHSAYGHTVASPCPGRDEISKRVFEEDIWCGRGGGQSDESPHKVKIWRMDRRPPTPQADHGRCPVHPRPLRWCHACPPADGSISPESASSLPKHRPTREVLPTPIEDLALLEITTRKMTRHVKVMGIALHHLPTGVPKRKQKCRIHPISSPLRYLPLEPPHRGTQLETLTLDD